MDINNSDVPDQRSQIWINICCLSFAVTLFVTLTGFTTSCAYAGDASPSGTRIHLSAMVEAHIPNDEVVINFRIEQEGKNAAAVREYVNRVSSAVHHRLTSEQGLQLKTLSRTMQPQWRYPKNSARVRSSWRMTQSEQVVSHNLDAVSTWLDVIEANGAHLSGLQFRISSSTSIKAQEQLRLQAIAAFRKKAAVIARGLSAPYFRIIQLNTSSQSPQPAIYRGKMAMMARSADAAPPSLSGGEGKIRVSINGSIEVPFTDFPAR